MRRFALSSSSLGGAVLALGVCALPLGCNATCIRDSDCMGTSVCSQNRCILVVRRDAGGATSASSATSATSAPDDGPDGRVSIGPDDTERGDAAGAPASLDAGAR